MEPQIQNLISILSSLYSSQVPQKLLEIDKYLKSFQRSKEAWPITFSILESNHQSDAIYLFNAITLKYKLLYDFEELQETDKFIVKNKLIQLCHNHSHVLTLIRQLGLCLGIISIHLAGQWNIMEEAKLFSQIDSICLLELLKAVADGVSDKEIVEDHEKVEIVKEKLRNKAGNVLKNVIHCQKDAHRAMEVFVAWMKIGVDGVIDGVENCEMLKICWDVLENGQNVEIACLVLNEMIELTDQDGYCNLTQAIWDGFLRIWPSVQIHMNDFIVCEGFVNLFMKFVKIHYEQVFEQEKFSVFVIVIELGKAKIPNCVDELASFWHKTCKFNKKNGLSANILKFLDENLTKVLQILVNSVQLDSIQLCNKLSSDAEELRSSFLSLFKEILEIFTLSKVFGWLNSQLLICYTQVTNEVEKYSRIESICLYLSSILNTLYPVDPSILSLIDYLTSQIWPFTQLNLTICSFFENFSALLPVNTLLKSFNFIASYINSGFNYEKATGYFKSLCVNNCVNLFLFPEILIRVQDSVKFLSEFAQDQVLEGISSVFWAGSADSEAIIKVLQPYTSALVGCYNKNQVLYACKKLALIFQVPSSNGSIAPLPVYNIFKALWPVLHRTIIQNENFLGIPEAICSIFIHAIKKLGQLFYEFLPDLQNLIHTQFSMCKNSCYLNLLKQIVTLNPMNFKLNLFNSLHLVTDSSLLILNSLEQIRHHLDLVHLYFSMVNRYLTVYSQELLNLPIFPSILDCGICAMELEEAEQGVKVLVFLRNTLEITLQSWGDQNEAIKQQIYSKYQSILSKLFNIIIKVAPAGLSDQVQDLTFAILSSQSGHKWLEIEISQIPPDCFNHEELQKFKQSCLYNLNLDSWLKKLQKRAKNRLLRLR